MPPSAHRSLSGGVTSSSLEVLAGLALSTDEYVNLMIFKDGQPSEFYQNYVKDIQAKITENAAAEFSCIWKEHARLQGAKPRTIISDELSSKLNDLQAELEASDLFDDEGSRRGVMRRAIPKTLIDQVGLDTLLKRLPETYQRALFSSWVASHFVRTPSFCALGRFADESRCRFTSTASTARPSTSSTLPGTSRHRRVRHPIPPSHQHSSHIPLRLALHRTQKLSGYRPHSWVEGLQVIKEVKVKIVE